MTSHQLLRWSKGGDIEVNTKEIWADLQEADDGDVGKIIKNFVRIIPKEIQGQTPR